MTGSAAWVTKVAICRKRPHLPFSRPLAATARTVICYGTMLALCAAVLLAAAPTPAALPTAQLDIEAPPRADHVLSGRVEKPAPTLKTAELSTPRFKIVYTPRAER